MKRYFENLTSKVFRDIKHWWLMLIPGIVAITAGICVFVFPIYSYVALSLLFGVLILITGIAHLMIASASGNYIMMRGYVIVAGVLDLILGVFLCLYPQVTLITLPIIMGLWMMYHSFVIIAFAGDLNTFRISGSVPTIISGILLLALSLFVILDPLSVGVATILVVAGVGLILLGWMFSAMAFKLRTLNREEN